MLPLHTQKSLDQLTWNEVQKLHSSLGLKATAETRTRRDYQRRIVANQPQPVVELEAVATALTCSDCPLARHIEGDRYCCPLTDSVVRGHWEAYSDCYNAIVAQVEAETTEIVAEVEAPIAHQKAIIQSESGQAFPVAEKTGLTNHLFRYRRDIHNGNHSFYSSMYGLCECIRCISLATVGDTNTFATIVQTPPTKAEYGIMTALVQETPSDRKFNDLTYLTELEMNAQLAIEKTCIGSEEEKIALLHLRKIERDIAFYNRPQPELQASPVIAQLAIQMKKLKVDVSQFTIDDSILTVAKPKLAAVSLEPEGTIHWHGPLQGTIVGKKSLRNFYIKSRNCLVDLNLSDPATYEIMIVFGADFTAAEFSRPNIRHQQIRSAIVAGRSFNPRDFKNSEEFLTKTEDYCGRGRVMEHADGRWWAWSNNGVTGQPFSHKNLAQKYLNHVADRRQGQAQKVEAHAN